MKQETRGNGVAHKEGQLARSDLSINSPHTLCLSSRPPPFISPQSSCVCFLHSFKNANHALIFLFSLPPSPSSHPLLAYLYLVSFVFLPLERRPSFSSSIFNHVWHTCSVRLLRWLAGKTGSSARTLPQAINIISLLFYNLIRGKRNPPCIFISTVGEEFYIFTLPIFYFYLFRRKSKSSLEKKISSSFSLFLKIPKGHALGLIMEQRKCFTFTLLI